jgi:hypothetical protein
MTTIRNNFLTNKYWGSFIPVLICLFLSPPFDYKGNFTVIQSSSDFHYYDVIVEQMKEIKHLPYSEETHESKMEVRILMPLILKLLLPNNTKHLPILIYIINLTALYAFSLQICIFQKRKLPEIRPIFLTSLLFTTIYTGICYAMDFWPMFDGIAFLLLITALNQDIKYTPPLLLLLSLFIDERSLFPGAMILIYQSKNQIQVSIIQLFFIILTYLGIRIFLNEFYGLNNVFHKSHDLVFFGYITKENFSLFLIAIINCFKNLWILPIYVIFLLRRSTALKLNTNQILAFIGISSCFLCSFFAATAVTDFTRSFSYGFPLFLISLKYIHDESYIKKNNTIVISLSHLIIIIIICNLLTETHFFHSGSSIINTVDLLSKIGAKLLK